ncbi:MAG: YegS/Rv2252/BmrU family lipid kinase [Actinobacteria bacterium]|uniref:Diacylglycerol kinase n=1 Tax=Nostocoides veronense TaxID=330836 RepID=A0ABN2LF26_9MICO|nr:YegS/Rv2252/BmrU family lipid kinase [Actinomycetota bacterium]
MTEAPAFARVGLVVNPSASAGSAGRAAATLGSALARHGLTVTDLSSRSAGGALAHAQHAVRDGEIDLLVVAGGDGMAHLGVNACAGTDIPLGIVALGTGNDIATGLGLPIHDAAASVAMIAGGHTRAVDAGRVDGGGHRPWFGGTLYAGFDAVVNARANRWSWPKGQARYNLAVVRELPVFSPIPYAVTVDGTRHDTEAMLVIVANAASYGGGMQVTPEALMDDGLFDVLILERVGRAEFLRVFPKVFAGTHVDHPAVRILRGARVRLDAEGITSYADGEPFHPVPLRAEVVPGALRVIVPAPEVR